MFRRSSRGLTKKYREEYNSVNTAKRYASRKNKPSFEGFIKEQYNTTLGLLKNEFSKYNNNQLTKDELKLKRRVMNSSKIKSVSDVSKNISRAVKRLDIVRDILGNTGNLNTSYDNDSPSNLNVIHKRLKIKEDFIKSDIVNKPLKKLITNASPEDLDVVFDFLGKMRKKMGVQMDAYYQLMLEDFYDKIQQQKQRGNNLTTNDISFERLDNMINLFKIENADKYDVEKDELKTLIEETWSNRKELSSDEERFIKKIYKYEFNKSLK